MIRKLPLIAAIPPLLGVGLAYWLGVKNGVLPSCVPFIEGCTSISSTGRYLPGSLPFRAVMLPQAAFLAILWWFCADWIRQISPKSRVPNAIIASGIVGAVALVLYVTFLGTQQPFYELMRRFGIYLYFLGTASSQVMVTAAMPSSRLRTTMLWVVGMPLFLGITNLLQKELLIQWDSIENSIEWIAALLMQVWFMLLYVAWRDSGLAVTVTSDPPSVR